MYREYLQKIHSSKHASEAEKSDDNKDEQEAEEKLGKSTHATSTVESAQLPEVTIKVSRNQITQGMINRVNKINKDVDFKVYISFSYSGDTLKVGPDAPPMAPVLCGDLSSPLPPTVKIVRIFTSSTFTDTKFERNTWMEKAYPRMKAYCQSKGYEFQIVDMRWGVRDEATDDHRGTELCLRELELCQQLSTGPNFTSLLSHKYGYQSLPRELDAVEFEKILSAMDEERKQLLCKWFIKDYNAVPAQYTLQPISKNLPDFLSSDQEKKKEAKSQWWKESEEMQDALQRVSAEVLSEKEAMKYIISITHHEVLKGILEYTPADKHCLWFRRTIDDIESKEPSYQLSRYIECLGPENKWRTSRKLLNNLRDKDMTATLPENNICSYIVPWTDKGIDPTNPDHSQYLEKITEDFEFKMREMIDKAIEVRTRSENNVPVYTECVQHLQFCKEKANAYGRGDILERIREYITSDNDQTLVLHGMSGCGKTTIMAMVGNRVMGWTGNKSATVIRFVGTSLESTGIIPFLKSIIIQIKKIYGQYAFASEDLQELISHFQTTLGLASPERKLVLLFDSLDQFDAGNNARQLLWVPNKLPENVKMVVSTLEDPLYDCYPKLKSMIKGDNNFISVPALLNAEVNEIINMWLKEKHRCLTKQQFEMLVSAFEKCPLPVFLKLSFDVARTWTSYNDVSTLRLESTVRDSIDSLFSRLEMKHGKLLVSRSLGYLTASRNGLSEAELEDVLACDDDVLNDVYVYWTPPIRRLPPLLLVRIRTDLDESNYLVNRESDGVRVTYWYHRQFIEAATARYCSDEANTKRLHLGLAEYFSGTWSHGKKKPFKDNKGNEDESDRYVSEQPIKFGEKYNIRKVNNLPFHRILSGDRNVAKEECLFNIQFLLAKLKATSILHIFDDFDLARKVYADDKDIEAVSHALRLSEDAVGYDPNLLPVELIGRLPHGKGLEDLVQQCKNPGYPYILPDSDLLLKADGQLQYCLTGHTDMLEQLDITENGRMVVTCAHDQTVKTWDVMNGRLKHSYDGFGTNICDVCFLNNDEYILIRNGRHLLVTTEHGDVVYTIPMKHGKSGFCVGGPGRSLIAEYSDDSFILFDSITGQCILTTTPASDYVFTDTVPPEKEQRNANIMPSCASKRFMAFTDHKKAKLTVFSIEDKTFSTVIKAFGDGDDEERTVDTLAIPFDEKHVILADCLDNDVLFYDITTLEQVRCIKGIKNDLSRDFHVTKNLKYLYFPNKNFVAFWDLQADKRGGIFPHGQSVMDVKSVDLRRFVTISIDNVLRVWDATKPASNDKTPNRLGVRVRSAVRLSNPRYVVTLTIGYGQSMTNNCYLNIHDLVEKKIVRQSKIMSSKPADVYQRNLRLVGCIGDSSIVITTWTRKIKVVSLDDMSVIQTMEGKISQDGDVIILQKQNEIVTQTRGRSGVKFCDIQTGKTIAVIPQPDIIKTKATSLYSGQDGRFVVVTYDDDRRIVIINTACHSVVRVLHNDDVHLTEPRLSVTVNIAPNDAYIAFSGRGMPIGFKGSRAENVIWIWNTEQGRVTHQLFDREDAVRYKVLGQNKSLNIYHAEFLDSERLITSNDDTVIRVWNCRDGKLLKRLDGIKDVAELIVAPDNQYFLMNGSDTLQFWNKDTLDSVASYKLEKSVTHVILLDTESNGFICCESQPARLIHWKVHIDEEERVIDNPPLFHNEELSLQTHLMIEDDESESKDDPDNDEDEKSDDEDDE